MVIQIEKYDYSKVRKLLKKNPEAEIHWKISEDCFGCQNCGIEVPSSESIKQKDNE